MSWCIYILGLNSIQEFDGNLYIFTNAKNFYENACNIIR